MSPPGNCVVIKMGSAAFATDAPSAKPAAKVISSMRLAVLESFSTHAQMLKVFDFTIAPVRLMGGRLAQGVTKVAYTKLIPTRVMCRFM